VYLFLTTDATPLGTYSHNIQCYINTEHIFPDALLNKMFFLKMTTKRLLLETMKLKLIYDQQSVGQSVLVSGAHLGPVTNFSFSLKFPLDSCGFVTL
jgi:hypothetical protein